MNIGVSDDRYTPLMATADEEEKFDAQTVDAELGNTTTPAMSFPRPRPRYTRQNRNIPGSVTGFEQDMIFLTSTFSETHFTEAGRYFVERHSRVTEIIDLTAEDKLLSNHSRIVMWPTHRPDVRESFNGDFCSDVNWIFAYCQEIKSGGSDCLMAATIIGSLFPMVHSGEYSALYSSVLFDKPDKYLRPKGETLRAAIAACNEWAKHRERISNQMRTEKWCCGIIYGSIFLSIFLTFTLSIIEISNKRPHKH